MSNDLRHYIDNLVSGERMQVGPFAKLVQSNARYLSRAEVLEVCLRLAEAVPGDIVEFGVADGASTRVIRKISKKRVFALDSFEGLREKFENAAVGAFAGPVPNIPGVTIVKGYFEDTCTDDLRNEVKRVAFAHLDADLYGSTVCALRWLTPILGNGSLLLFDEFTGGDKAEARAFADWQRETETAVVRIAEFDRNASGWGAVPDKRVLFQVIRETSPNWIAIERTCLKAENVRADSLPAAQKVEVAAGQHVSAEKTERFGDHTKLSGVKLEGRVLSGEDWYIFSAHWMQT